MSPQKKGQLWVIILLQCGVTSAVKRFSVGGKALISPSVNGSFEFQCVVLLFIFILLPVRVAAQ